MTGRPVGWEVLGLVGDPTPGDPGVVVGVARSWGGVADDAEVAERGVRSLVSDGAVLAWVGAAGEVFGGAVGEFPEQLRRCRESFRWGAEALWGWAGDLEGVQGAADRALVLGRAAAADLAVAREGLSQAQEHASVLGRVAAEGLDRSTAGIGPVTAPAGDAVRVAHREAVSARAGVVAAQVVVLDARERLEAARVMALDAGVLRDERGRVAAARLHEAAGAGIPPRSAWESFKDGAARVWDVTVAVARVVVAVLGVVALIVGGPLAWVVFAAALLVLADTLAKYSRGEATGWDVLWALIACIPATKGLTTLAELATAAKAGGLGGAGSHVLGAGRTAVIDMAVAVRGLSGARTFGADALTVAGSGHASMADAAAAAPRLDGADLAGLADYSGPNYTQLNPFLRGLTVHTAEEAAELTARVDAISRALAKLPPFNGDVRRGANLTPELWDLYTPGRTVQELAFTSTTRLAEGFTGNTQFRIVSVTGKDISAYSVFPEEQEILFDKGTQFLVLGHEVAGDMHIIQMMEITRGN